jgi:flagellar hook assembly protein FlgD
MGFVPDSTTVSGVDDPARAPVALALRAEPNPCSGATSLGYTLPAATQVEVTVHDVQGRLVATLWSGTQAAGAHVARWDGRDPRGVAAPAGVYLCRVRTVADTATTRVMLVR